MSATSVILEHIVAPSELLPRSGHCAAQLPAWHPQDLIVVSGYVESPDKQREPTNEAWVFSATSKTWSPVKYGDGPVPRERIAGQAVVAGDRLWLIGGWDPRPAGTGGEILSDVWSLDLKTYVWKQETITGEQLQPISRFQAVSLPGKIVIHTHRNTSDILILDITASPPVLKKQELSGTSYPASRGLHSLTALGGKLYLYGGAPQHGPMFGDMWVLDLDSASCSALTPSGPAPQPRCAHVASLLGDKIIYFGGARYRDDGQPGLEVLGDWAGYDTATNTWLQLDVGAEGAGPSPRNAATMVALDPASEQHGGKLALFGGWKAFVESYNDTYVVEVKA